MTFNISTHDSYPPEETALVDRGLGEANDAAAPLGNQGRPSSCFASTEDWVCSWRRCGSLVGPMLRITTTLGRAFISPSRHRNTTGPTLRSSNSGARLLTFYLETFSFQTPRLYERLGYTVVYGHKVYPHGIVNYMMVKTDSEFGLTLRSFRSRVKYEYKGVQMKIFFAAAGVVCLWVTLLPAEDASQKQESRNTFYGVIDGLEMGRIAREEGHAICHSLGRSQNRALYADA